jgi:two-component system, NarL family, sensor histidine kinase DegS
LLVMRSQVPGKLKWDFYTNDLPAINLPFQVQQDLLRIAQESLNNAICHANPTMIIVRLRWDQPNLILEVKDNGSGIAATETAKRKGLGLASMQTRATNLGAKLEVQTAAGFGTNVMVRLPIAGKEPDPAMA